MFQWESADEAREMAAQQGLSSYAEAAKKIKLNNSTQTGAIQSQKVPQNNKGKGKQQYEEPNKRLWNQQNIDKPTVNVGEIDRINKLEQQMEKFLSMLQKLNERVSNLEINYINHTDPFKNRTVELSFEKEDSTFTNNNNKRVKKFQETRESHKAAQSIPDVQSRTLSPMEEDSEADKATDQFVYEPSMNIDTTPPVQGGNTQRLDNFEQRMDQAFSLLTIMSGKFDHFMNNQEPYINTDRAKEFNNGTTNPQNLQK
ncbi:unnamed protein product [Rhizophagus irregularis]|nr:unnamed protein product [Rhizophagus irregularis]